MALILVLLGIIGLGVGVYLGSKARGDAVPFTGLAQDKGKMVKLELTWLDTYLAEGGDPQRWYHFGQTAEGDQVVLALNEARHKEVNDLITADPTRESLKTTLFEVTGLVESTFSSLRPFITEQYNAYGMQQEPTLPLGDERVNYMVSDGKVPGGATWPYLFIVPGILGIVLMFTNAANKRKLKRSEEEIKEYFPAMDDYTALERDAQLSIPSLQLLVHEPLLISYKDTVQLADLRQVGWLYVQHVRQRYTTTHNLQAHMLDKKVKIMQLGGKKQKQVEADLEPIWAYVAQHHPDIQLGFAKEQRQAYKSRL